MIIVPNWYELDVSGQNRFLFRSREGEIMLHDVDNDNVTQIMDNSTFVSVLRLCYVNHTSDVTRGKIAFQRGPLSSM